MVRERPNRHRCVAEVWSWTAPGNQNGHRTSQPDGAQHADGETAEGQYQHLEAAESIAFHAPYAPGASESLERVSRRMPDSADAPPPPGLDRGWALGQ